MSTIPYSPSLLSDEIHIRIQKIPTSYSNLSEDVISMLKEIDRINNDKEIFDSFNINDNINNVECSTCHAIHDGDLDQAIESNDTLKLRKEEQQNAQNANEEQQNLDNLVNNDIIIDFYYEGRPHRLVRNYNENVSTCINRLIATINKKNSKKKNNRSKPIKNYTLTYKSHIIDTSNYPLNLLKNNFKLNLEDKLSYTILINPPNVLKLSVYPRGSISSNCIIIPYVESEFSEDFIISWYIESNTNYSYIEELIDKRLLASTNVSEVNKLPNNREEIDSDVNNLTSTISTLDLNTLNHKNAHKPAIPGHDYHFVSEGKTFIPTDDHIGKKIKFYCTPYRLLNLKDENNKSYVKHLYGRSFVCYLLDPVLPNPNLYISQTIESRKDFLVRTEKELIGDQSHKQFRTMSYNILAETYCSKSDAYNYCNQKFLETEFRSQRIAKECLDMKSDILCLQECDEKTFYDYFLPLFGSYYYIGTHDCKGTTREGCATFINSNQFRVIGFINTPLKNVINKAYQNEKKLKQYNLENNIIDNDENYFYLKLFSLRKDLKYLLTKKLGTFVQITVVQNIFDKNDILIIANTHLYFHPLCEYIRLLQVKSIHERIVELKNILGGYSGEDIWNRNCSKIFDDLGKNDIIYNSEENDDLDIDIDINLDEESDVVENLFGVDENFNESKFKKERMIESMLNKDKKFTNHFNQNYSDIRKLSSTSNTFSSKKTGVRVNVLLMGDMNFSTNSIGYDFLAKGKIDPKLLSRAWYYLSHYNWKTKVEFVYKKLDEIASGWNKALDSAENVNDLDMGPISLDQFNNCFINIKENNLKLISGSGNYQYTNYVPGFKKPIDHLFYSSSLELKEHAPMPSTEELEKEYALPSSVFPSDHISISMDFLFH